MLKKTLLLSVLTISISAFSQKGIHGNYTASGTVVVNSYTNLTANSAVGATSISVASNSLTNTVLTTALAPGDLVLIVQMQGADMDINTTPTTGWGGNYTLSNGAMADLGNMNNYRDDWGTVTNYNNAGKYEYAQVSSVSGSTTINFSCGLKNAYSSAGHTQIVRVPRFNNLTLNASALIVPVSWNGTTGGVVAVEVNGVLTFNAGSKISASGYGFRGGNTDTTPGGPAGTPSDVGKPGSNSASEGAEKGEGIGGYATAEYTTTWYSRYGMGSPANGGGGANYQNAGGGGGSNVGAGTYTGYGTPNTTYTTSWNLELAGMAAAASSGGGRGGYSLASSNQNPLTVGPNTTSWGGDYRRKEGGLGGHPLTYDATRVFMGGGGGAGDQDGDQGGSGGRGGGLVFIQSYGSITGTGTIEATGAAGQKSNPLNQTPGTGQRKGNDGAGGGGGGGSVLISNGTAIPSTVTIDVTGGVGGNDALLFGSFATGVEANGPGGGGSGGFVNYSSGTPTVLIPGGANGTVTVSGGTNIMTNFPPNGATSGAAGTSLNNFNFYNLTASNVSICTNTSTTLTATITGTLPAGSTVYWYATQFGTTALGSGLTFTTPVLSATTTYYVGVCPGTFRIPVTVTVGAPTISGTAVVTNATCTTPGSITGLTTSGGTAPVTITWNTVVTPTMNLTNASAGSYTVTVTDNAGCSVSSGPYTISGTAGPTINSTNMVIANETCLGNDGTITGITASGTGLTYSWTNTTQTTLALSALDAGSYTLTVTDNNGCTATLGPLTVATNPGPSVNSTNVVLNNGTCGNPNGSISGLTSSGNGLTYSWTNTAQTTLALTNLNAGSYTLTVTDNLGCTVSAGPFTISNIAGPTISATNLQTTGDHCNLSDGTISGIVVTGGTSPLTITYNGTVYPGLDITNLSANNYTLQVTDANSCTASYGPITISAISGPSINTTGATIQNETCAGNDGAITGITATGTGLTYQWNLSPSASIDIANLIAGTYGLLVTDQFGCTATSGPYTVNGPVALSIDSSNMVVTNAGCTINNGSITGLVISGGINPTFSWSNSSPTLNNSNLAAGIYTLTVTDNQGCLITADIVVGTTTSPVIDATNVVITNTTCGQNDGSITGLTVAGGTLPYTYEWNNASALNTIDLLNALAATHTLIVTDAGGCTDQMTFTITNVNGLTVDASSATISDAHCGQSDGSISGIMVSGGINPLSYEWDNTPSLNTISLTNAVAGPHTIVVTDGGGCTAQATVTIGSVNGPSIDVSGLSIVNSTCELPNGSISGIVINSASATTVVWLETGAVTTDISGCLAGNYTLQVTDAFGCVATGNPITVTTTPIPLADFTYSPTFIVPNQSVNFVDNTSGATVNTFEWYSDGVQFGTASSAQNTYAAEGDYMVTLIVQTASGCSDTISKTITVSGEMYIPNLITMNNDGVNDVFEIQNLKPNSKLIITNRWGTLIFETENYINNWNGKNMAGEEVTEGVYFYQLLTVDGKSWQGIVNLLKN